MRLLGTGLTAKELAQATLYARGTGSADELKRRCGALRHQVGTGGKLEFGPSFTQKTHKDQIENPNRVGGIGTYDATVYTHRAKDAKKVKAKSLVEIAKGVVNWPSPQDSGMVTKVIRYAQQNNLGLLTTDDIPRVAAQRGFTTPNEATGTQWDQGGRNRMLAAIKASGAYA